MAPFAMAEADFLRDNARRGLLQLLEGVSANSVAYVLTSCLTLLSQVRGKKNLVISKDLTGPLGLFVKFSVLQEYGVDKVFLLETENVDSSQRNVVFLVRAVEPKHVQSTAGMYVLVSAVLSFHAIGALPRGTNSRLRRPYPTLHSQS